VTSGLAGLVPDDDAPSPARLPLRVVWSFVYPALGRGP
jgi:hypothetical protein